MYSIKNILIVLLVVFLLFILGLGGYYYYFEIKLPGQYAREIVPLYEKLALAGLRPDISELGDEKDYQKALDMLREKKQEFNLARQNLLIIKAPQKFKSFHQDFLTFLELNITAFNEAESRTDLLIKANELNEALKKISQPPETDLGQTIKTVVDFQKFFKERISKPQLIGQDIFKEDLPLFNEPPFSELKSSWVEVNKSFNFILDLISSLNPKLSLEEALKTFSPAQNQKAEAAMKKVEEFSKLLDEVVNQNTTIDILSLRYFTKVSQTQMSENFTRIYNIIQELKKQYSR